MHTLCSSLKKFSSTKSVQTRFAAPQKPLIDTFLVIKVIISYDNFIAIDPMKTFGARLSLRSSFFEFWENFAPPPGIRPSFVVPGQRIRQKIARVAGIRSLKKKIPEVALGDVSSWNWLRHNCEKSRKKWSFSIFFSFSEFQNVKIWVQNSRDTLN